jgi:hypothetical protein
MNRQAV